MRCLVSLTTRRSALGFLHRFLSGFYYLFLFTLELCYVVSMSVGRMCSVVDLDLSSSYIWLQRKMPYVHSFDFIYTRITLNLLFA